MKKYQIILILLAILLYLLKAYFSYNSLRSSKEVRLSDINLTVIDIRKRLFIDSKNFCDSTFKLWDLDISKILEDRKEEDLKMKELLANQNSTLSENKVLANINASKRKICLEKECWQFMGMITINNKTKVTLLSTDKKPKLETFSVGDELLEGLTITEITGDKMIVVHKKDERKFILKLFEVNASAYFPKSIKEVNE